MVVSFVSDGFRCFIVLLRDAKDCAGIEMSWHLAGGL